MGDHIHHHHHHVELSDDIILEIFFLQLPVKYIFQYRSFSKTSNRLLFYPSFYAQYQRRRRLNRESQQLQLLGFFQGCKSWYWTTIEQEGAPKLSFLPVCKQGMPLTSRPFLKRIGFILGFFSGLTLCGRHPVTYFVCNPINLVIGFHYHPESHGGSNRK